ncbi:MAG: UvrD-helicase domain-containing protein [Anaerolinea sp.]|nr:UvrD-helicase domain-containing protein [Anaerolinea sp.]
MFEDIEITDDDLSYVGVMMGGYNFTDEERSFVIKHLRTSDVQACPGSGKTTALAAKLIILASKLPDHHAGICVLSHTNAAREEISKYLSKHATRLLRYPNFVGTIQQFVDQFLAIPAMIYKYGIRPSAIDDEIFYAVSKKWCRRTRKLQYFLDRRKDVDEIISGLRYGFDNIDIIRVYVNGQEKDFPTGINTDSYREAQTLKNRITQEGYIGYHDAFSLANWYLELNPQLSLFLSSRFPLLFIDEMQDTDYFQARIIEKVFLKDKCVVQCLGDTNQTIYSGRSDRSEAGWRPSKSLEISHSYRLSPSIARLTQNVCQEPQVLVGNQLRPDRNHTIFMFEDVDACKVLEAFGQLISQEQLQKGPFKAVGYVKGPRQDLHLTISSYWPEFSKVIRPTKHQDSFRAYCDLAKNELDTIGNCGKAREHLIDGLVQVLRHEEIKQENDRWFSRHSLLSFFRSRESESKIFDRQLLLWISLLATNEKMSWGNLELQIASILRPLLPGGGLHVSRPFLDSVSDGAYITLQEIQVPANVFYYQETTSIEIETIHGVKGQTHEATLLLETYWHDYHLHKLLPYLKGGRERKIATQNQRRLNLAYVAMSRPTDLLCLAMRAGSLNSTDIADLERIGWKVERL